MIVNQSLAFQLKYKVFLAATQQVIIFFLVLLFLCHIRLDLTLEWFEKSEIFLCKRFEMSKSAAQLLYGPELVFLHSTIKLVQSFGSYQEKV